MSGTLLAELGPALRLLREERGLTQVELARAAALSTSQVSAYERARRRPSLASLERLLCALDADLAKLQRALHRSRQRRTGRGTGSS